jgi:hypothetical protein
MKRVWILVLFGLLATPLSILAQTGAPQLRGRCGTSIEAQQIIFKEMDELRKRHPFVAAPRAISYVPVWFHMVATTAGVGRTTEANIADMLCEWNRLYSVNGIELQFFIKGFSKVDHDVTYNSPRAFAGTSKMVSLKKTDALNVYLVNNSGDGTEPAGTIVLAYYDPTQDIIVCNNSQVNSGSAPTIVHEAGHAFTLAHTFFGWESAGPFVPTAASPCAPQTVIYNGQTIAVEKVARTGTSKNCDTAADGFCDTPEDYNFGFSPDTRNCVYAGIAKDPECVAVNPDETNLMGYFGSSCENKFSIEQKNAIMNNYLNSPRRAYLRAGNITPPLTGGVPTLVSPAVGAASTPYFNNIVLDWSDVPSVLGYGIEISRFASFTSPKNFFSTTSDFNINALNAPSFLIAGTRYYWRVKAVAPFNNCANASVTGNFTTGTVNAVQEIAGVTQFTVSPNPLSTSQTLSVQINSEKALDATIKLFNVAGQLIKAENRRFAAGYSSQNVSVTGMVNGTYILTLESENGVINKRIVIQ